MMAISLNKGCEFFEKIKVVYSFQVIFFDIPTLTFDYNHDAIKKIYPNCFSAGAGEKYALGSI
jgi:hypothetical protein